MPTPAQAWLQANYPDLLTGDPARDLDRYNVLNPGGETAPAAPASGNRGAWSEFGSGLANQLTAGFYGDYPAGFSVPWMAGAIAGNLPWFLIPGGLAGRGAAAALRGAKTAAEVVEATKALRASQAVGAALGGGAQGLLHGYNDAPRQAELYGLPEPTTLQRASLSAIEGGLGALTGYIPAAKGVGWGALYGGGLSAGQGVGSRLALGHPAPSEHVPLELLAGSVLGGGLGWLAGKGGHAPELPTRTQTQTETTAPAGAQATETQTAVPTPSPARVIGPEIEALLREAAAAERPQTAEAVALAQQVPRERDLQLESSLLSAVYRDERPWSVTGRASGRIKANRHPLQIYDQATQEYGHISYPEALQAPKTVRVGDQDFFIGEPMAYLEFSPQPAGNGLWGLGESAEGKVVLADTTNGTTLVVAPEQAPIYAEILSTRKLAKEAEAKGVEAAGGETRPTKKKAPTLTERQAMNRLRRHGRTVGETLEGAAPRPVPSHAPTPNAFAGIDLEPNAFAGMSVEQAVQDVIDRIRPRPFDEVDFGGLEDVWQPSLPINFEHLTRLAAEAEPASNWKAPRAQRKLHFGRKPITSR